MRVRMAKLYMYQSLGYCCCKITAPIDQGMCVVRGRQAGLRAGNTWPAARSVTPPGQGAAVIRAWCWTLSNNTMNSAPDQHLSRPRIYPEEYAHRAGDCRNPSETSMIGSSCGACGAEASARLSSNPRILSMKFTTPPLAFVARVPVTA
jgi:hypothetical protein